MVNDESRSTYHRQLDKLALRRRPRSADRPLGSTAFPTCRTRPDVQVELKQNNTEHVN